MTECSPDDSMTPEYQRRMFADEPGFRDRFYVQPESESEPATLVAPQIQPPSRVVKNMQRLQHDEMASWTGIAALRNFVVDAPPEDQQAVVDAGAAEAIIQTMRAWPDHAGIQVSGSGTLVKICEIDAGARRRVLEAGGICELAAAAERLEKHTDSDGDAYGKHVVMKAQFARDCLIKVAGKKSDPRNRKHIQAAIDGGIDPKLFVKIDPELRRAAEERARAQFSQRRELEESRKDAESERLLRRTPWAQTMDRDREVCVLFPGQGTQKKGMADKLVAIPECQALFARASEILGYDLAELIRDGPQEKLDQTLYAQPAVFVTSLAHVEKAKTSGGAMLDAIRRTKTAAGFSLGEYSALVYANVLTFEDGLRLVKARAEAMHAAAEAADAAMATIAGLDDPTLLQIIAEATQEVGGEGRVYIANYMFPEGRSCSGDRSVLRKVCERVGKLGSGKSAKLAAVSGAFHTPYMKTAQEALSHFIDEVPMELPTIHVISNVTGTYYQSVDDIRALLKRQLVEPVQWERTMDEVVKGWQQLSAFVETGPGKQLKAMMRRIDQDAWGKMTVLE